jgi:hypothetical protein
MKVFKIFGLLLCSLIILLSPASLASAQASAVWTPGFYAGWVSFFARIDTEPKYPNFDTFVLEKFDSRGQLMVKVNDQGLGKASIVLPTEIKILDYGAIKSQAGDCTFSSYALAQTNYVRLQTQPSDVSESFVVPISLSPGIRYTNTNSSSFGSLKGCEQAGGATLTAMKKAMRVTTAEMREIKFTVKFNDKQSIGGDCKIVGWEKVTSIPNGAGQGVRSLPKCQWRVFKVINPNTSAEWKK